MKKILPGYFFYVLIIFSGCNGHGNKSLQTKDTSERSNDTAGMTVSITDVKPGPDYWLNDSILTDSVRKIFHLLVEGSGLTRTWIQRARGSKMPVMLTNVQPDATYHTTLIRINEWQKESNMDAEVRRFGRLLLGFALGSNKHPASDPEWIGYDTSGKLADEVDGFYTSFQQPDSVTVSIGKQLLSVFPKDLEFRTYVAVAAKKIGDTATLSNLKPGLQNDSVSTRELKKLFVDAITKRDFGGMKGLSEVLAHRSSFGRMIRKL